MKRLQELRNNQGLRQDDLAEIIGTSRVTVSRYEKGTREPDNETLLKLSEFFGVSTDYLLGNTDDPTPPSKKKPTPETVGPALTKVLKEAGYLKNDQPLTDEEAHRILKYLMAIREADSKE